MHVAIALNGGEEENNFIGEDNGILTGLSGTGTLAGGNRSDRLMSVEGTGMQISFRWLAVAPSSPNIITDYHPTEEAIAITRSGKSSRV